MNQIVTENEGLNDLPKGWLWTKLGEVGQVNPRIDFGNLRDDIDVSFLPMKCVEELTGRIDLSIVKRLSEVKKGYTSFKDGDLLFAKITPCMENGKVAIVDKLVNGIGFGSTEFHVLKLYDELPRKYFFHFLVQESVRRDAQRNMSGSAGQLRVPSRYMKSALIPLAPLSEQHRIVNKIEELFTKLDAGVENLNKIKIQLKRYRQSVLKSAFEGKLTEEWRKQNKEKIEPADKLLNRILGERRDMCEERELAKMKTRGKVPRDQIWKEKYKEPEPPNTDGLMELPEGWCWASVEQLASDMPHSIQSGPFGSNLHHKEFQDSGKLVIGIDNVQDGRFSLGAEHRINDHKYEELKKYIARGGDVLLTVMATIGRCCVVPDDIEPAIVTKHVYRITPEKRLVLSRYLLLAFQAQSIVRYQMFRQVRGQTRPGLNGTIIKRLVVPVPPLEEQHQIFERLDEKMSSIEHLLPEFNNLDANIRQMRECILRKAFSGQLVPQDPNDETASELLERIKLETSSKVQSLPKSKRRKTGAQLDAK